MPSPACAPSRSPNWSPRPPVCSLPRARLASALAESSHSLAPGHVPAPLARHCIFALACALAAASFARCLARAYPGSCSLSLPLVASCFLIPAVLSPLSRRHPWCHIPGILISSQRLLLVRSVLSTGERKRAEADWANMTIEESSFTLDEQTITKEPSSESGEPVVAITGETGPTKDAVRVMCRWM
ncbi:hypothetical protein FRC08_002903 [Ceratobasidium sp. 394]|nr:hypothetical protein FRC08_002903 [Ceratobasidium sp. 394]